MTDHNTSQRHECFVDVVTAFVAGAKASELMQPRERAFDDPTKEAQTAAVSRMAFAEHRFDASFAEFLPMRLGVITPVALNFLGAATRPAPFPTDRRDRVDQRQQLGEIVSMRAAQQAGQRDAAGIGDQMVLAAAFAAIRGIRSGLRPPKTARTDAESTTARDQSISSAACKRASRICRTRSHTPAASQSRSRRQQVMPLPQPISCGRSSQAMPVLSTNRIPVRARRCPIGFLPGYRNRRGFGGGSTGSMTSHNASSKIGFAILVPPCTRKGHNHNRFR